MLIGYMLNNWYHNTMSLALIFAQIFYFSLVVSCDTKFNMVSSLVQVKAVNNKYDELESQLMHSVKKVVDEITSFQEDIVKPQRCRVERANELLLKVVGTRKKQVSFHLHYSLEYFQRRVIFNINKIQFRFTITLLIC